MSGDKASHHLRQKWPSNVSADEPRAAALSLHHRWVQTAACRCHCLLMCLHINTCLNRIHASLSCDPLSLLLCIGSLWFLILNVCSPLSGLQSDSIFVWGINRNTEFYLILFCFISQLIISRDDKILHHVDEVWEWDIIAKNIKPDDLPKTLDNNMSIHSL